MNSFLKLISFLVILAIPIRALSDSPLTSTNFSISYQNEEIVIRASKTNGKLTKELIEYLINKSNPVDLKMALINQLGWDDKGKKNSNIFWSYIRLTNNYKSEEEFCNKGNADELICFAYLKAIDNYFEVDKALKISEIALTKNTNSYTFHIISALIRSQKYLNNDWCEVYKSTDSVRKNTNLNKDLRDEAISVIFDYMDNYGKYCCFDICK